MINKKNYNYKNIICSEQITEELKKWITEELIKEWEKEQK